MSESKDAREGTKPVCARLPASLKDEMDRLAALESVRRGGKRVSVNTIFIEACKEKIARHSA